MNTNLLPTRNQIIHSALLALVTMLFAGLWDTAQAQGAMVCRDVDNLTICGSTITNFNGGGSFTINGPSVWLGPKGGRLTPFMIRPAPMWCYRTFSVPCATMAFT